MSFNKAIQELSMISSTILLSIVKKVQNLLKSGSELGLTHSHLVFFSQACGGLFLLIVFLVQHDPQQHTSFSQSTVILIYSAFTALTLLGVLILAILRMPSPQNRRSNSPALSEQLEPIGVDERQNHVEVPQSHLEILSNLSMKIQYKIFSFQNQHFNWL